MFEVKDDIDIGPSPGIDGLIRITYDINVAMNAAKLTDQLVLVRVDILKLVDQYLSAAVSPFLLDLFELIEDIDGLKDQIVEVQGMLLLR